MRKFPHCTGCASPDSEVLLLLLASHRSRLFPVQGLFETLEGSGQEDEDDEERTNFGSS